MTVAQIFVLCMESVVDQEHVPVRELEPKQVSGQLNRYFLKLNKYRFVASSVTIKLVISRIAPPPPPVNNQLSYRG